MINTKM